MIARGLNLISQTRFLYHFLRWWCLPRQLGPCNDRLVRRAQLLNNPRHISRHQILTAPWRQFLHLHNASAQSHDPLKVWQLEQYHVERSIILYPWLLYDNRCDQVSVEIGHSSRVLINELVDHGHIVVCSLGWHWDFYLVESEGAEDQLLG